MSINSDCHGDFQNSTNSSWDQIQATLKILLPSYQPLPSDSQSSILHYESIQKQNQLHEEINQSFNRICATLNEMIQEEETNLDPEIQAKSATLDPEIQTQIHSSSLNIAMKSSTDQGIDADSEPFFSKSENQCSESSTTFPEIGNTNQKEEEQADTDEQFNNNSRSTNNYKSDSRIQIFKYRGPDPNIQAQSNTEQLQSRIRSSDSTSPYIQLHILLIQIQRFLPDAETRDDDWNAHEVDAALESTFEGVNRPPPKPPHLQLHAEAFVSAEDTVARNRNDAGTRSSTSARGGKESVPVGSSAEDGAVTKGKVEDNDAADQKHGSCVSGVIGRASRSAEVGAFAKRKRMAETIKDRATPVEDGTAIVTNGGLVTPLLRRFFLLTPPPLLAASFPWDRGGGGSHGIYGATEVSFSSSRKRQASMGVAPTPCSAISTTTESPWSHEGEVAAFCRGATQSRFSVDSGRR
ncbi:hypothetical protein PIB30_086658 [Stylosanthes scabra]|uniref:Uncharacterized protein n=1 Tax=Stylosanthes scabra TaxID=79078 RepID=A0ABU6QUD0_9FABA|nr:hypothetical protein [Stylosanthes scabra]